MHDFFERRRAEQKRTEETATGERMRRIKDRTKHGMKHLPPGNSSNAATVFVWDTFDDIRPRIVRRRVIRDAAEDVFLQHNKDTRRFDPYRNEWDCWKGWAPRTQSDDDALLDEMYPDDDVPPPMNSNVLGLPSPVSSRSSTPLPSTRLQAVATTPEPPTSELVPTHVTDVVQEDDAMDVVQVTHSTDEHDHLREIVPSPRTSEYKMDESADDDDVVSLGSHRSMEDSTPPHCLDSDENDLVEVHTIDTRQHDDLLMPIDESVLEQLPDAFMYRYGFCVLDAKDFCFSSKAQGYSRDDLDKATQAYVHRDEVIPRHLRMPIIDFANILVTNYRIENGKLTTNLVSLGNLWDLSVNSPHRLPFKSPQTENQLSPALRIRAVTCTITGRVLYIISEAHPTSKFTYNLILEQATTALECYRRKWQSLLSVAKHLIQSGKAFRTYIPRDPHFTGPPRSRNCRLLGCRSQNHVFRPADYCDYEDARGELFGKPFGRAAPLMGGVIWRLFVDTIGDEVVLQGPSTLAHEFGDLVTDPAGKQFVDDTLSEDEMDLICGKYVMYTGQKNQTTYKWWWPPHSTWIKGSYYVGYWTGQCERWFRDRLRDIKAGKAQPLSRNEWKAVLHRSHLTHPLVEAVEAASFNYFQGKYYH
jgi:hypothetical protein